MGLLMVLGILSRAHAQLGSDYSWQCNSFLDSVRAEAGTQPNRWSFMVTVDKTCRGALVASKYVLTAPSCCRGKIGKMVYFSNGRRRLVENVYIHHKAANRDLNSELCLMQLKKPIDYSEEIYPVCLNPLKPQFNGLEGFIKRTVWGYPQQAVVVKTQLNTIDHCGTYKNDFTVDYSTMGCIKSLGAEHIQTMSRCQSDNGLPVISLINNKIQLTGIITWTTGNCKTDVTGYVTQIEPFREWIKSIVTTQGFWENPTEFKPADDFAAPDAVGGKSDSVLTISQPTHCQSQIDGYGYTGQSDNDEIATRMKAADDFAGIRNGTLDAESTVFAGMLPPAQMRTSGFWANLQQKIVGSSVEPDKNNWRWIVDFNGYCAGSLISSEVAVTTAMCCLMQRSNYAFIGGFSNRKSGLRRAVAERQIHPDFDQSLVRNDICLVRFAAPVPFGPNIQPVCLPPSSLSIKQGTLLHIAGWGSQSVSSGLSKTLRSATLPTIPFQACYNQYKPLGLDLEAKSHVCAMKNGGGVGPCRGDWGAPAVFNDESGNNPTLYGMVSFGRGCALDKYASIYVNVASYVDWIDETAQKMQGTVWPTVAPATTTTTTTTTTIVSTPAYDGYLEESDMIKCAAGWDQSYGASGGLGGSRFRVESTRSDPYKLYGGDYDWNDDYEEWDTTDHLQFMQQQQAQLTTNGRSLGRISGGKQVQNKATWPFAIRMEVEGRVACGATLIGKRWALTAAHCCVPGILNRAELFIGDQQRTAAGMVQYPGYNEANYNHNICVFKLDTDVQYNDRTQPACLSENMNIDEMEMEPTYIAGFGEGKEGDKALREAIMRVISDDECKKEIAPDMIKKGMFCATGYYPSQNVNTCAGHAGGPHVRLVDGHPKLTGLISWGNGCAIDQKYSLYTSVSHYNDFIKYAVNQLETGTSVPYVPGVAYPDSKTLKLSVATYSCTAPLDSFASNFPATIPAEQDWPWLINIHHQCFGVLVGASQVLTSERCCPGRMKGKYVYSNTRRRMIFNHAIHQDLCLIQLNVGMWFIFSV